MSRLGVDLTASRVVHACEGKGKDTLKSIQQHLESKCVPKEQMTGVSIDLSPAFIAGAAQSFPEAEITFDRFHVVKLLNEAMNKVRMAERLEHDALKGHKYTFLKNWQNLSDRQETSLSAMIELYPTLGAGLSSERVIQRSVENAHQRGGNGIPDQRVQRCRGSPNSSLYGLCKNGQGALGRVSSTSLNRTEPTAYWKTLIAKFS